MENKGRIQGELRYFQGILWNSIKLDNELRWEIRVLIDLERELEDESTESKTIQFGSRFAEKSESELDRNFWRETREIQN